MCVYRGIAAGEGVAGACEGDRGMRCHQCGMSPRNNVHSQRTRLDYHEYVPDLEPEKSQDAKTLEFMRDRLREGNDAETILAELLMWLEGKF